MKDKIAGAALILLALGIVAGSIYALNLIGADTLRVLALVLAVPIGVAIMAWGLAPLVRAWRTPTAPPIERQIIRERLHMIDNRPQPVPGSTLRQIDLYPGLHSAEWRAGLLDDGRDQGIGQGWGLGFTDQHGDVPARNDDQRE